MFTYYNLNYIKNVIEKHWMKNIVLFIIYLIPKLVIKVLVS